MRKTNVKITILRIRLEIEIMTNYENYKSFKLGILLLGYTIFGIALPIGVGVVVKGAFFPDGAFSTDILSTWETAQFIAVPIFLIIVIIFTIYCFSSVIKIAKEFQSRSNQ